MLTHSDDPRILAHFKRLRQQIADLMPSYLVFHNPSRRSLFRPKADIVVKERDFRTVMLRRRNQMTRRNGSIRSHLDLIHMFGACHPKAAHCSHVWFVECDVDFSGDWRDFFAPLMARRADLLATRIRYRDEVPRWYHWRLHRQPDDVLAGLTATSFNPLIRLSRRFIDTYREEMSRGGWDSHWEALYPTAALHHGLLLEDILGTGRFGISRSDPSFKPPLTLATFGYRPVRSTSYFFETPSAFREANRLYHPVKVD
jgi:hypothetical protein